MKASNSMLGSLTGARGSDIAARPDYPTVIRALHQPQEIPTPSGVSFPACPAMNRGDELGYALEGRRRKRRDPNRQNFLE